MRRLSSARERCMHENKASFRLDQCYIDQILVLGGILEHGRLLQRPTVSDLPNRRAVLDRSNP